VILVHPDAATRDAIEAGTYHGWDCANERYDASFSEVPPMGLPAELWFEGLFDVEQIAIDYEDLPGIDATGVVPFVCNGEFSLELQFDLDACAEGDSFHYLRVANDASEGVHLVSEPGSPVEIVCSWAQGERACPPLPCL
jgi:hypothetical protein